MAFLANPVKATLSARLSTSKNYLGNSLLSMRFFGKCNFTAMFVGIFHAESERIDVPFGRVLEDALPKHRLIATLVNLGFCPIACFEEEIHKGLRTPWKYWPLGDELPEFGQLETPPNTFCIREVGFYQLRTLIYPDPQLRVFRIKNWLNQFVSHIWIPH